MNQTTKNYFLSVNGKQVAGPLTFNDAKQAAIKFMNNQDELMIESFAAPAPSVTHVYDYEVGAWAETSP